MNTFRTIEALPTLSIGQEADLKVDHDGLRLWLSRIHRGELALEIRMGDGWQEVWRGNILHGLTSAPCE